MSLPFGPLVLFHAPRRSGSSEGHRHAERNRTRFRLEALEDRRLPSGISAMTVFPTTSNTRPGYGRIASGPDGNLWFTEYNPTSQIGTINPTTDVVSEFPTPTSGAEPRGITAGPDGNLWFTENAANKIGMINPTTHAIREFSIPTRSSGPEDIMAGPDGNLWFTENATNKVGSINPTTHAFAEFAVPTKSSGPFGITAGPDGNLWFTERNANKVGSINPTTHAITEYATGGTGPLEIARGPDGNLWFGQAFALVRLNPTTHAMTSFATPNGPDGITAGPDGNVWFSDQGFALHPDDIGRLNPTAGALTLYPVTSPEFEPYGLTTGPDGNLWFNEFKAGAAVGVATLSATELAVTQAPPSSVVAGSAFAVTVQAEDSSGNLISSFNGTVTVALVNKFDSTIIPLGGTLTVQATNGVATFPDLSITTADTGYRLVVSGGGLGWGVTGTFAVTAAAVSQVVIMQQPPASVGAGSTLSLGAAIENPYGSVVASASNVVRVALAGNVAGAINVTNSRKTNVILIQGGLEAPNTLLSPLILDSPDFFDTLGIKKRSHRT